MAIHRVDLGDVQAEDWHDQGVDAGHAGYKYCATLREAKRAVAEMKRTTRDDPYVYLMLDPSIESRPTPRNKREWVALLNEWGSHNENG